MRDGTRKRKNKACSNRKEPPLASTSGVIFVVFCSAPQAKRSIQGSGDSLSKAVPRHHGGGASKGRRR